MPNSPKVSDSYVKCTFCGSPKKPNGRSAPIGMEAFLCNHECPGYYKDPQPTVYWPGERDKLNEVSHAK